MKKIIVTKDPSGTYSAYAPELAVKTIQDNRQSFSNANSTYTSDKWAPWGADDQLPTRHRAKIRQSNMAGLATFRIAKMLYGNGIAYYKKSDLKKGTNPERLFDQEIDSFISNLSVHWFFPQAYDMTWYLNSFTEVILSRDKKSITSIAHKPAEYCRVSELRSSMRFLNFFNDVKNGIINKSKFATIPLYEPTKTYRGNADDTNLERFIKLLRGNKFAFHTKLMTPGTLVYAEHPAIALFRKNGWIDVSANVPSIVSAMQRNQKSIKYHILIPESYFKVRYSEWHSMTDDEKDTKFSELVAKIDSTLSDTSNAFASITTFFRDDEYTNADHGKIEIVALDDKMKRDTWVPSSTTADAQIVQGFGSDPSQHGLASEGGKIGAGSGSDKREVFNTIISTNNIEQEAILEVLQIVSDYNQWGVTFFIDHTHHTTTNNQESGLIPSPTTIQPK